MLLRVILTFLLAGAAIARPNYAKRAASVGSITIIIEILIFNFAIHIWLNH